MARVRRYELYEGDGEAIRGEDNRPGEAAEGPALPGRQPRGRDEALRERDVWNRQQEERARRHRYFRAEDDDDGLGPATTLFDDFDRFENPLPELKRPRYRRKEKHRGAWAAVLAAGLAVLLALVLLALPQTTGVRYRFLPNLAFVNGNLLRLEPETYETFRLNRKELYTDLIYPGVYIDGVHVGGMTREQAAEAVAAVNEMSGPAFDIVVSIGNQVWHVNSERVPVSRNVQEQVNRAWVQGRRNTAAIRGTGITPFQERVNRASELRSYPLILATKQDYDHTALREMAEGIANYVNREPVNSTVTSFDFNTHTFGFSEDRPGARLDAEALYRQLTEKLDAGVESETLRVEPQKILAEITRTELMNRFGLISTYTTKTTSDKNRNTNIRLSAEAISGTAVMPGETFSFNRATGERTAAKGYREAPAISGGQSRDETGGGVCQTSSTLFNAVARANLEIVDRSPHAWPSNYVEKGFDATVNWPGLDFQFRNNTDWPVFITAAYQDRKVTVNLYGMSLGPDMRIDLESVTTRVIPMPEGAAYELNPNLPAGESKKTVTGRKGYEVETWKVWYQGDREIKRELLFKTTYKAYQEKWEYNPR